MRQDEMHGPDRAPTGPGRAREARSNDIGVLRAAREIFAERGWDAPVSAIADRAGVGVGSIYRRYRTKEELAQSLRVYVIDHLTQLARDCVARTDPDQRLLEVFFRRHLAELDSPLIPTLGGHLPRDPEVDRATGDLSSALEALIDLARDRGQVPDSFTAADIMLMTVHLRPRLPTTTERARELHERYLDFMLMGIAHAADRAEHGPSWDEWYAMWQPN
ncbi:AcrR family transcriptional regulator [Rhodococcus sp. PvR044]|jgi:AcrR family transcriptional regulator|uniref:TetR/AcrR family transcriptional regulator n=1 Tax=Rhodococcus TaxID=1827 RepID=UPI001B5B6B4A|nr:MULTISPECIES: TetR/AcrR family transcriptional regulator [Rhodococcus]MBP1158219.1 AcrR family transcriptional regulator [Rhodococcus sp. PvR099]MCZ4554180.1 helix-turn-helix domain containing protein [Rhodococcus maanshanensis]